MRATLRAVTRYIRRAMVLHVLPRKVGKKEFPSPFSSCMSLQLFPWKSLKVFSSCYMLSLARLSVSPSISCVNFLSAQVFRWLLIHRRKTSQTQSPPSYGLKRYSYGSPTLSSTSGIVVGSASYSWLSGSTLMSSR